MGNGCFFYGKRERVTPNLQFQIKYENHTKNSTIYARRFSNELKKKISCGKYMNLSRHECFFFSPKDSRQLENLLHENSSTRKPNISKCQYIGKSSEREFSIKRQKFDKNLNKVLKIKKNTFQP